MKKIDKLIENFLDTGRVVREDENDGEYECLDKIADIYNKKIIDNEITIVHIDILDDDYYFSLKNGLRINFYYEGDDIFIFYLSGDNNYDKPLKIEIGKEEEEKCSDIFISTMVNSLINTISDYETYLDEKEKERLRKINDIKDISTSLGDSDQISLFITPELECVKNFFQSPKIGSNTYLKNIFKKLGSNYDENVSFYNKIFNDLCQIIKSGSIGRDTLYKKLKTLDPVDFEGDIKDVIKQSKSLLYELSFCKCENDYFRDCNSNEGQTSALIKGSNTYLKTLIDDSSLDVKKCVDELYKKIIEGDGRKISKHDTTSNKKIKLEGGIHIEPDLPIEVKYESKTDFILSEFFSLYKNEPDRTNYNTPERFSRYNSIISGVVEKLNVNDGGILNLFDATGGIFLKNYMYYPKEHYRLYWSDKSDRSQLTGEKRLTVRFEVTGEGHQWREGNCNLQNNEDFISEYVENFLDL
tara:strand:- start:3 stop:1412 length:1410 start_codon:yes stop_codon:yes gene_type:complete